MKNKKTGLRRIGRSEQKQITGGEYSIGWCCGGCELPWGLEQIAQRTCGAVARACHFMGGYFYGCYCDSTCEP